MTPQAVSTSALTEATFAALRLGRSLVLVGGGYETDVYHSRELGLAFKLKFAASSVSASLARARQLQAASDTFRCYLGPEHSLPNELRIHVARSRHIILR